VRQRILRSDVVVPTLSAISQDIFNKINRPAKMIRTNNVLEGLRDFRHEFTGKIWLECFIVPGLNDNIDELTLLKNFFLELKPEKIQLNSLARLGSESWVKPTTLEEMEKLAEFFKPLTVDYFTAGEELKDESTKRR